jgi:hypothetical protein
MSAYAPFPELSRSKAGPCARVVSPSVHFRSQQNQKQLRSFLHPTINIPCFKPRFPNTFHKHHPSVPAAVARALRRHAQFAVRRRRRAPRRGALPRAGGATGIQQCRRCECECECEFKWFKWTNWQWKCQWDLVAAAGVAIVKRASRSFAQCQVAAGWALNTYFIQTNVGIDTLCHQRAAIGHSLLHLVIRLPVSGKQPTITRLRKK